MSLSHRALLASLNISLWTGRKHDKRATATVESTHATREGVGNFTKMLLPGAAELEEVKRLASSIREFFSIQTVPWAADGTRMIAAQNYLEFTKAFRERKGEFDRAVGAFLSAYPTLCAEARVKLGDLFRGGEYPTAASLATAFGCEVSFMPVPDVGDFRVEILDSERATFLEKIASVEREASRDCWSRLYEVVSKAADRLADPNAILKESLLENVRSMCDLLPRLNVSDDPKLEAMRNAVETTVMGLSAADCREDRSTRADAARKLDAIAARMGSFMAPATYVPASAEEAVS